MDNAVPNTNAPDKAMIKPTNVVVPENLPLSSVTNIFSSPPEAISSKPKAHMFPEVTAPGTKFVLCIAKL